MLKLIKTLHEREEGGVRTALAVYENEEGAHVYGVSRDGAVEMTGTKAEAKAFYGNWRKTCCFASESEPTCS